MGAWCSSQAKQATDEAEQIQNNKIDAPDEIKEGPIADRKCTDMCWIPILIAAQIVWIVVTIIGMADGNPVKLYKPRDFQGAYCGVSENWNDGPDTSVAGKASYTMNLTSVVDQIMKQTVCSSLVTSLLVDGYTSTEYPYDRVAPLLTTNEAHQEYLCDCCLVPCLRCGGMVNNGGDLPNPAALTETISARMGELTGNLPSADLFNPATSANGNAFSSNEFWSEATKYFYQVCLPECNINFDTMNASLSTRFHIYKPAPDDPLYFEWMLLLDNDRNDPYANTVREVIENTFKFEAFPKEICPYEDAGYCVPMPGVGFSEVSDGADYCTFEMTAEVISAVGDAAAAAFTGIGGDALLEGATMNIGELMGDFEKTIDSFLVVCFLSFVIGIIFLVLLRFFIGVCVWVSVFLTVFFFLLGGIFCFIRSGQCKGVGFFDTSQQAAVAIVVAGATMADDMINDRETVSEAMDPYGDGTDYTGVQKYTKSGKSCLAWETQNVIPSYNPAEYYESNLIQNYCRNPYNVTDLNRARTIWCVTSDTNIKWEECTPIGVIQPPCQHGYSVASESARDVLWYASFVIWGLGGVWVLIIICMRGRIQLAIALNKVAAVFVSRNPHIVIVPIIQSLFAIIWITGWCYTASYLLSQVPKDYTPQHAFATYEEAYGTTSNCAVWEFGDNCTTIPGACTDRWPTGTVYKSNGANGTTYGCELVTNETTLEVETRCYRCFPPRYVFDWRFWVSFFVFLWNNAFNMALGQILIAMATCVWFFKPKEEKSMLGKTVGKSFYNVFRYHIGSVAFGSFIVAVVQFIRYLMKYFEKQAAAQKNRVMVLVLKVLQCCLWCFEKCIQFLNKNAYIQICLLSKNFCVSAKNAFWLIARNALRFATVATLSHGIHFIGYMMIISGTMVMGYYVVREMHEDISPVLPLLSYFCAAYMVAKLYMNVFALAVDASLQCFLLCEEKSITGEFVPDAMQGFVAKEVDHKKESSI